MAVLLGLLSIDPDRIKTMADAEVLMGSKPREIHFSGNAEHYPEPLFTFLLVEVIAPMVAQGATFERFMYNPRLPFPIELVEAPPSAAAALPPSSHSAQLLSRLLDEVFTKLEGNDRLASFAGAIKRERDSAPRYQIRVAERSQRGLLSGTPYEPVLRGTLEDALRVAGDLLQRGLSVHAKYDGQTIHLTVDEG